VDDLVGGELNSASYANYDPVDHLTTQRVNLIEGAADGKPLKSADLQTLCPAHPAMPDSKRRFHNDTVGALAPNLLSISR
jgi:hypothetical protein